MNRFFARAVVVLGAAALGLGTAGGTAPIPKDAGKADPTPDLKVALELVEKAVKAEKWPAEADEKALRETAGKVFERALAAAGQKARPLPADALKAKKADVAEKFQATGLDGGFVVARDVRITGARNCIIFASGNVQITRSENCVIVARNVRCTLATNCTILAGDSIRLNGADPAPNGDPCVLVAGQWIRTTTMTGTVCHVLRPTGLPAPDEVGLGANGPEPAIRTNGADGVIFLNVQEETRANGPKGCTYLPQKNPIAK